MLTPEIIAFVSQHLTDDVVALSMKHTALGNADLMCALSQIKARQAIRKKLPSWYENLQLEMPVQLSVEQSSSELTAKFKASLFPEKAGTLVDMTGGMGVDCCYLSQQFDQSFYIERNSELCEVARHNFAVLGRSDISVNNTTAEDFLHEMSPVRCIFIDPARRNAEGQKVFFLSDCVPDVQTMIDEMLAKADSVLIKLSPMLDWKNAVESLRCVKCVYVIAVENECKELLLWADRKAEKTEICAVNFSKNSQQEFRCFVDEESSAKCEYTNELKSYLYEPNVAILKAGAFKLTAQRYGLCKLHPNTHLYTSDNLVTDFPGRVFSVESSFSFSKNDLKTHLGELKKANLTVRNFPESVEKLRTKLKLKEGGDTYLFACTLNDERKVLVKCCK